MLLDTALSVDTVAMEEYFEKGDVSVETLKRCIKEGAITGAFRPVLCGTAFKNKGVQPLLDAVLDYLPSPVDVPGIRVAPEEGQDDDPNARRIKADPNAPFAGLAFKIINDKYGSLTFVRVYAGTLKSGDTVMNTTKDHKERIGRMFQMHADKRAEVKEVVAGDIAAFVGLKDTGTGDTLASADDPVVLERMAFPVPVIDISVEPKTKEGVEKMTLRPAEAGLGRPEPAPEDRPGNRPDHPFRHGRAASGNHHRPSAPRIWRRRQHRRAAGGVSRDDFQGTHRNLYPQEAVGRFGPVRGSEDHLRAAGAQRGRAVREQGRRRFYSEGIHPGRGKGHQATRPIPACSRASPRWTSNTRWWTASTMTSTRRALAFEIAAKACFREGMKKASPIILEPIMDVEITTPQDHVGDVVGDLNRRRGMIQNQESSGSTILVHAHVPLKEMFGYISHLRSMTKGRASFTMQFHHYDPVPRNVAEEIMAKSA